MNSLQKNFLLAVFPILVFSFSSFSRAEDTAARSDDLTAAATESQNESNITNDAVQFSKGDDNLSVEAKDKLSQLVKMGRAQGEIDQISVAVWSDRPFPARGNRDLPKADRDLADRRSDQIKKYLKDELQVSSVRIFNMAERSNWLARTLRTPDAELKSVFSKKGGTPVSNEEFNIFRAKGAPSCAVAVVELKNQK